jgi:hypothetical protein
VIASYYHAPDFPEGSARMRGPDEQTVVMTAAAQHRVNHFVQHRGADFTIRGMVRHVHV